MNKGIQHLSCLENGDYQVMLLLFLLRLSGSTRQGAVREV